MHYPCKCLEGIFIGDLRISPRERSEALMVPHENFVIVVFVADWHIWLHHVKATAVDSVDELQHFLVNHPPLYPKLRKQTVTPNDQMSVAVVHGSCI